LIHFYKRLTGKILNFLLSLQSLHALLYALIFIFIGEWV